MGVYSRNQTTTQTPQEKPQVASKDLSTVIIESFDSVKEQLTEEQEEFDDETESEKDDSDIIKSLLKDNLEKQDDLLSLLIKDETENTKKGQLATEKPNEFQALLERENRGVVESSQSKTISSSSDVRRNEFQGLLESKQQKDADNAKNNAREAKAESSRNKQTNLLTIMGKGISTIVGQLAKAALIVVALSQAIVLVKAGWAWLQNYMPVKFEKTIADIRAAVSTIPEKIRLNLEKTLSRVKIMGKPVFSSGLSDEEKAEKKELEKNKDVKGYSKLQDKIDKEEAEKEKQIKSAAKNVGIDTEGMDVNDIATRAKIQGEYIKQQRELLDSGKISEAMFKQNTKAVSSMVSSWNMRDSKINDLKAQQSALVENASESSKQSLNRYAELRASESQKPVNYDEKLAELDAKQEQRAEQYYIDMRKSDYEKGIHSTETQAEMSAKMMGWDVDEYKAKITGTTAEDYVAKGVGGELRGDKYLRNEFADWTRAWEQLAHNLKQNIGLRVEQLPPKNTERNPTSCR